MINLSELARLNPVDTIWLVGPAFLGGLVLGFVFFGGLWWTVRRVPDAGQPGLLVAASFAVRTLTVLAGMYWMMDGRIERLAACMMGFLVARLILLRRWRPQKERPDCGGEPAHGHQS